MLDSESTSTILSSIEFFYYPLKNLMPTSWIRLSIKKFNKNKNKKKKDSELQTKKTGFKVIFGLVSSIILYAILIIFRLQIHIGNKLKKKSA